MGAAEAFVVTATFFVNMPGLAALKVTLIDADAPGLIGSLGHSTVVHPHDGNTLTKIKGDLPVFLNVKEWITGVF